MLDICLLGTGGMMPLPYRWLTSMMARCDGSSLLIDPSTQTSLIFPVKKGGCVSGLKQFFVQADYYSCYA